MILLTLFSLNFWTSSLETILKFQDLPEQEALGVPFSVGYSEKGDLYVLDAPRSRIHVWNSTGSYRFSFGQVGPGPGEIAAAVKLVVQGDQVWIWGYNGNRLSRFSLKGTFIEDHQTPFRFNHFGVLNPNLFISAYKKHVSELLTEVPFQLVDLKGTVQKTLATYPHKGYLSPKRGHSKIKAFGPDIAIQQSPDGHWYFGFSQTTRVFAIDGNGNVLADQHYDLPEIKPTEEDRQLHGAVAFATYRGGRNTFERMDPNRFDFSFPMAFYTQFVVTKDRITFVLTPLGGFGSGAGYHQGRFYTCDRASGTLLEKGSYALEEDSKILFSRGRGVAFIPGERGDYQVLEVTLKGKARR